MHAVHEADRTCISDDFLIAIGRLFLRYVRGHGHTTGVTDLELRSNCDRAVEYRIERYRRYRSRQIFVREYQQVLQDTQESENKPASPRTHRENGQSLRCKSIRALGSCIEIRAGKNIFDCHECLCVQSAQTVIPVQRLCNNGHNQLKMQTGLRIADLMPPRLECA